MEVATGVLPTAIRWKLRVPWAKVWSSSMTLPKRFAHARVQRGPMAMRWNGQQPRYGIQLVVPFS